MTQVALVHVSRASRMLVCIIVSGMNFKIYQEALGICIFMTILPRIGGSSAAVLLDPHPISRGKK